MPRFLTTEQFIEKSIVRHGPRYDYREVRYVDSRTRVKIICPIHGEFEQTAAEHLIGKGCQTCGYDAQRAKKCMGRESWIARARTVHGNRYDYSKVEYQNNRTKVVIVCPKHGEFLQRPEHHLNGVHCPICAGKGRGTAERFATASRLVHGDAYDYSSVVYADQFTKVELVCPTHGSFWMIPTNHQSGQRCPKCARLNVKAEEEICTFLDTLGVEYERGNRSLIHPYEIDIYLPALRLGIEYCGLYWHSEATGRKRNYHLAKHLSSEKLNIRLLTIFEDEWRDAPDKVKATIRHFAGKSERGYGGREVSIREMSWADAREFLDRYHLLGAGRPGFVRLGAYHGEELIGCMVFGAPSDERGKTDLVEMKRFVTDGRNHPGLGSKLFKWAIRKYQWPKVVAFVDRRWFTGSFKTISGFLPSGYTAPSLFWTDYRRRYHRRSFKKETGAGTKRKQLNQKGLARIWDCGKIRMEWTNPNFSHL